ncbi:hypothetical protein Pmani_022182 [Petrolisthes manimaculis]|uniref:Ig-like domain-containing protein n=1 Tax=Petrolisthes manimaculis TaxID=1843537 RepID=A0AAE1U2D9_9EUCA|nr:hypothetical protein Pmani_022182 [Petrolisthes manimaculis]
MGNGGRGREKWMEKEYRVGNGGRSREKWVEEKEYRVGNGGRSRKKWVEEKEYRVGNGVGRGSEEERREKVERERRGKEGEDESVLERQLQESTHSDQGYKTRILGSVERILQAGSSVWLVCVVMGWPPPPAVLWYHRKSLLHPHQHAHRLSVQVEEEGGGSSTSKLHLHSVTIQDSGNYSCLPVGRFTCFGHLTC